ncbi:MAG: hypothetical protein FWG23_03640 [Eggerthellaceae bacterium]|jgi:DMSO/TMAO reductase YedYZ heme-binding membrane subunit|nr:hypothetical protein [Eggerthellaceae bacterium]MDR2715986.1 hypothetical protein [Coriobacteriaceae bacterium]
MIFLITLLCVIAFSFIFKAPLEKAPWAFYALALVLVVLFVCREGLGFPVYIERPIFYLVQKCTVATALFVVVMFIGVFSDQSRIRRYLMPVRAELSILGCLMALGHIINYLMVYLPQVMGVSATIRTNIVFSFGLALFLVLLLVVLGATSFNAIKRRMSAVAWKRVQWFAYPFFLLIYVHSMLFLLPPALNGSGTALFSVAVYTAVFAGYLVARSVAALRAGKAAGQGALQGEAQEAAAH